MIINASDIARFERHISKDSGGCWLWTSARLNSGYAYFGLRGRMISGHRFSYSAFRGKIPDGICVCHTCDVRHCVNPDHLFLGTHKDNMQDAKRKGRIVMPPRFDNPEWIAKKNARMPKGSDVKTSKLTETQVLDLMQRRTTGISYSLLAKEFGLDKSTVADICTGQHWPHVLQMEGAPTIEQMGISERNARSGAKITIDVAREIKRRLAAGETGRSVALACGLHFASISDIKRGMTWRDA